VEDFVDPRNVSADDGVPLFDGNGTWNTPAINGAKPSRWITLLPVSDSAPRVRPWKAPVKAMKFGRRVDQRASFIAPSMDSAPELVKNTRACGSTGASSPNRSARRTSGS
jgi:hypothetical protein